MQSVNCNIPVYKSLQKQSDQEHFVFFHQKIIFSSQGWITLDHHPDILVLEIQQLRVPVLKQIN